MDINISSLENLSFEDFKNQVLEDYKIAVISRECSLLGRREVLTGKGKFGIFGDGKEVPQLAMARAFKDGDFRSGYYRDQTLMMAIGEFSIENFFAGIYAHTDIKAEPTSAGRQMGGHFTSHSLDENGNWKNLVNQKNTSSDISPTAGQMPRLVGLAQASKIYRNIPIEGSENFSNSGNEVAWGTIGNASTSEGHFFEALNAIGVLQVPVIMCIWDDGYGISVPSKYQTTKENISEILKGLQRDDKGEGFEIFSVKGWDYPALLEVFEKASQIARGQHVPVLIHVTELTQPVGHSTSGSHERYKSPERLKWEKEYDCIAQMRQWILNVNIATEEEINQIDTQAKNLVKQGKNKAWEAYQAPIKNAKRELINLLYEVEKISLNSMEISHLKDTLAEIDDPYYKDVMSVARKALRYVTYEENDAVTQLRDWVQRYNEIFEEKYNSYLYSETPLNPIFVEEVAPQYEEDAPMVDGRIVIRDNFDKIFETKPEVVIFGEDVGFIGDVNQGLEGLQEKYGEYRISDTGIREATIIGQGIGLAMRGLRPIAEIQYLDYILYGLQTMSDDLATLHYRSYGRQKAPLIVRTRGHRLEGIWHAGSPMGGLLHLLRGVYILVPRNMTKAAGFYNTLLQGDQPALIVECLNGYRLKEKLPTNLGKFKTPIGVVETIRQGKDITVVSYGSTLRIVEQAVSELEKFDISIEIIDVQSLLPFDINKDVVKSIQKTNRLLIIDEDVPGGASAYLLQEILEKQDAYRYLDSKPETLTAKAHRPAFSSDGDYFSKPNVEDVFEKIYMMMNEVNPIKYPKLI
ncbi:alpha-ketoacid dehydrogenase subunit alpha/beta [Capnocytophaga catalasegens]|uniref:3-methyl-2-oxobutanoate dehydrogenase (2-methylpropanoyl-transferring) n=1 Tax=Capnocytophaga catalasegens TaxID=1004260 RepID=A0AAV5AQM4_9FLAO|nr:alpha-ketoacid dehydrogenase subunit alpha/beta [Capnocytophaga catalasegens]GIZ15119.1 transketolase [Capnocytophaga catalasegens]GJM49634.1 transketolase [Capnocytophaga catalasegens]GJM52699.1 transketolase [Capnocytophaga catalasegens]